MLWEDISCPLRGFAGSVALHPPVAPVRVNPRPLFSWGLALPSRAVRRDEDLHEYFKFITLVLPGS